MGKTQNQYDDYIRQPGSSALLNKDATAFNKFKAERERIFQLENLSKEVNTLQKDMGDIKMLLQQLVNGKTNG